MSYLSKWLLIPYFLIIVVAMCLGKFQADVVFGKSVFEEYLLLVLFYVLIDTQRILIKYLQHK
jgi:hypothetical protein